MEPYVVPAQPGGRGRWWWAAAWVVLVAVIAGGAVAVADGATTPEEQLDEVLAFVREHRTARFETETASRTLDFEVAEDVRDEEVGIVAHEEQDRSSITEGELDIAGRIYTRSETDGYVFESISLPDGWYGRVDGQRWTYYPHDESDADFTGYLQELVDQQDDGAQSEGGILGVGVATTGGMPDEQLAELGRVGRVTADGPGRLRIAYRIRDLLDAEDQALLDQVRDRDQVTYFVGERALVVEHGDGGRLDAIHEESEHSSSVTRYSDWGAPVTIAAPPADQVDRTPNVQEEDLAQVDPGPMVAPTDLPDGWQLLSGSLVPGADEDEECRFASLSYGPGRISEPAASVALVDPGCRWLEDQVGVLSDGEPVHWGPYDAYRHEGEDLSWYSDLWEDPGIGAAVRLPQGWVLVTTTEGEDVLARLVSSLAPYDPESAAMPSATVKAPS